MEDRITIIGLGCVGDSIGLALRQRLPALQVVGHDIDRGRVRQAEQLGAVCKTHWNLPASCEGAGLVILALPLPAVRETLKVLGPGLEEGCVVTDTAAPKTPALEWARQYLPAHARFIAGAPVPGPAFSPERPLSGPEAARADLFERGLYCLMPTLDTAPEAVTALTGLARVLGAHPFFTDPLEYDGLRAGAADLPALLSVAFLRATVGTPGWLDMRKVAGHDVAVLGGLVAGDPGARREAALLNRENLLRRLDMLLDELGCLRQALVAGDDRALEDAYTQAAEGATGWLRERAAGTWGESPEMAGMPTAGEQISHMLLGGLAGRRPRREKDGR
jgi:prephenate dehydrogenase